MKVNDILSRTSSNISSADVGQLSKDFKKASQGVLTDAKYDSRAKIHEAGFDREYDKLQGVLSRVNIYGTTTNLADSALTKKQIALQDIRAIITNFRPNTSDDVLIRTQQANDALNQIVTVLNRKDDGKYMFGSKNNDQPPVQIDITTLNSQNLNTFTNIGVSENIVQVSDTKSVNVNMANARDIAPLIAAVILYKSTGGEEGRKAVQIAIDGALKGHALLETNVLTGIKTIEAAQEENSIAEAAAKEEIANDLTVDLVTQADKMSSAMRSLLTTFSIMKASDTLLNKVMDASVM